MMTAVEPAGATSPAIRCGRCGYDLRGLRPGAPCPECGLPTRRTRRARGDQLADAPLDYLRALTLGFRLLLGSGMGLAALVAAAWFVSSREEAALASGIASVCAGGWLLGACIVTAPRRSSKAVRAAPMRHERVLRLLVRGTQALWLAGPILAFAALACPPAPGAIGLWNGQGAHLWLAAVVLMLVAGVGITALMGALADLAEWALDTGLAQCCRASAFGLGLGAPLLVLSLVGAPRARVLYLVGSLAAPIALAGVLAFLIAIVGMTRTARWAVRNHLRARERDARELEKFKAARAAAGAPPEP